MASLSGAGWRELGEEDITLPQRLKMTISVVVLAVAALIPCALASGQNPAPPSLEEQLQAQYKLAQMGGDASAPVIVQPGSVLTIKKAGILGVSPTTVVVCPAKYQDGALRPPTTICATMVKRTSRAFQVGEKVYFTKLEVNSKSDRISVRIVACDSCNGTNPPASYKAQVDFQFPKGILETGNASKVENTLGQVFANDSTVSQAPQAAPPATQPPPPSPASIQLGQTIDQVVAALGQPEKMVNLGAKQIYVYKDLKVTFLNGKVSDVQ